MKTKKHLSLTGILWMCLIILSTSCFASQTSAVPGYDASLFTEAAALIQQQQNAYVFLVDVRPAGEFNTFKIPDSINIPLSFIKTKAFLKTKPVVLIHQDCNYSELISETLALNQSGFDIKILLGGLTAWQHKQGAIVGDPFAARTSNRIPAPVFFTEKDHPEWVIINAGPENPKPSETALPGILHAPAVKDSQPVNTLLKDIFSNNAARPTSKTNLLAGVILYTETGKDYDDIRRTIEPAYHDRVFYLKGGLKAYNDFLSFQKQIVRPRQERIQTTGHCDSCENPIDQ